VEAGYGSVPLVLVSKPAGATLGVHLSETEPDESAIVEEIAPQSPAFGKVVVNSMLVAVDDVCMRKMPFEQIMDVIRSRQEVDAILSFEPPPPPCPQPGACDIYAGPGGGNRDRSRAHHRWSGGYKLQGKEMVDWVRAQLVELYEVHNPPKVADVDGLLLKFRGREREVLVVARHKYEGVVIRIESGSVGIHTNRAGDDRQYSMLFYRVTANGKCPGGVEEQAAGRLEKGMALVELNGTNMGGVGYDEVLRLSKVRPVELCFAYEPTIDVHADLELDDSDRAETMQRVRARLIVFVNVLCIWSGCIWAWWDDVVDVEVLGESSGGRFTYRRGLDMNSADMVAGDEVRIFTTVLVFTFVMSVNIAICACAMINCGHRIFPCYTCVCGSHRGNSGRGD
jgi:hypothetical protein